jgi:predicted nucleic acid-binding protein
MPESRVVWFGALRDDPTLEDFLRESYRQRGSPVSKAGGCLRRSEELLNDFQIMLFDDPAARVFDRLKDDKRLRKIGRADLLIASIAVAQGPSW